MPLKYLILLIIAVCNIAWAFFIWLRNPKDKINIFFGLTIFFCGVWAGLLAINYIFITSPEFASIFNQWAAIATLAIGFNFVIFTYYFPSPQKILTVDVIFYLTLLFVISALIWLGLDVGSSPKKINGVWHYQYNNAILYLIYSLYLISHFGFGFYNLFTGGIRGQGLSDRVVAVIIGVLVAVTGGVIFGLVLPYFFDSSYEWVAPCFTVFMIGYISYHIFIKR